MSPYRHHFKVKIAGQFRFCLPWFRDLKIVPGILWSWRKEGIGFYYKGDEVTWLWPWKRYQAVPLFAHSRSKWLSLFCEGYFDSLKQMDDFWNNAHGAGR